MELIKELPLYNITKARITYFDGTPMSPSTFNSHIYVLLGDALAIYNTNNLTHRASLSLAIKKDGYIPSASSATAYNNNVLYCAQNNIIGIYKFYNYFKIQNRSRIKAHDTFIDDIASLDSGHIASISWDETVKIWDLHTQTCAYKCKLERLGRKIIALSPHTFITLEQSFACQVYNNNEKIKLFDIRKPNNISNFDLPTASHTTALCPLSEYTFLSSDHNSKSIKECDVRTGKWIQFDTVLSTQIRCLQKIEDRIIGLDFDNTLYVWDHNNMCIQKKKITKHDGYNTFSLHNDNTIVTIGSHGIKKLELTNAKKNK